MNEIWKDVIGYEKWYEVSDLGRVRRVRAASGTRAGKLLKPSMSKHGYCTVNLSKNGRRHLYFIHKLVQGSFVGSVPDGQEINHIDGDKTNNRLDNLEYISRSEHMRNSIDVLGKYNHQRALGEASGNSRMTANDVRTIRKKYEAGNTTQRELASEYGCSQTCIGHIVRQKTWSHIK